MTGKLFTRTLAVAGAFALVAGPVAASAQEAAKAPKPEDVQNAVGYLNVMIAALQSDKVEEPIKNALVGCLYNNSLGEIGTSMDGLIAQNADKVHRDKPNEVLSALAAVCGYKPAGAAKGAGR